MTPYEPGDEELPRLLIDRGWTQGAVFSAPGLRIQQSHLGINQKGEPAFASRSFTSETDDCFVVASQTCDIQASIDAEPLVEALLCRMESKANHGGIGNSARYFEVDRKLGLVAFASKRAIISKRSLWWISGPNPWPDSHERLKQFSRWLGRRFDRPALPDEIVRGFQQPMEKTLRSLRKEQAYLLFNRVVRQIRIGYDAIQRPPYQLDINLLTNAATLSQEEADAIETVMQLVYEHQDAQYVQLHSYNIRRPDMWSVADYLDTVPVFLDHLTIRGEEIVGALPPSAV